MAPRENVADGRPNVDSNKSPPNLSTIALPDNSFTIDDLSENDAASPDGNQNGSNNDGRKKIEDGGGGHVDDDGDGGDGGDDNQQEDDTSPNSSNSKQPTPMKKNRLKGYLLLLVSSLYNFFAAAGSFNTSALEKTNWCIYIPDPFGKFSSVSNLSGALSKVNGENGVNGVNGAYGALNSFSQYTQEEMDELERLGEGVKDAAEAEKGEESRTRYAIAIAWITILITGAMSIFHLISWLGVGKKCWSKILGENSKIELLILSFLTFFWLLTVWFNTTILGIAGTGKEEYNLYFTTWICCWTSFWTLERWCVASGRASFLRFVQSWPNRVPMWIVMFLLSLADFLFTLDARRNWEEGTRGYPTTAEVYRNVSEGEWGLLMFVTVITFLTSFAWVLAEIFRENRTNKENLKSDVEMYAEGFILHIITIIWVITVCIVTMPGGSASLLGNIYFTTWFTCFSCIGTLNWWLRDWRKGIYDVIQKQQEEYELAKRTVRKREERRMAKREREEERDTARETVGRGRTVSDGGVSALTEEKADVAEGGGRGSWLTYFTTRLGTVVEESEHHRDSSVSPSRHGDSEQTGTNLETKSDDSIDNDFSVENGTDRLGESDDMMDEEITVSDSTHVSVTTSPDSGVRCSSRSLFVSARSTLSPDMADN